MRTLTSFVRLASCGFLFLFLTATAHAQFKAGIQGTIKDTTGALVPEAKVVLTNSETGTTREATASEEGFYRISGLAPGKYKLAVEKSGYKQKVFDEVVVSAETTQGINVELEAGEVTATVNVTQTTEQALETENANVDKGITTAEVKRLPQEGRDPYELIRLTPNPSAICEKRIVSS